MEFYQVINSRKSIKKFSTDVLDKAKIDRIIHAAMMSPSWKNKNCYKFILVDNHQEKKELAATVMNNDESASKAIETAPMAVVMVADPALSGDIDNRQLYLVDSGIAMEHLILAATAEGYGTCWIAAIDEDKIRSILNVPNNYRVIAMTPVGMIEEKDEHYPSKNMNDFIFHNKWNSSYSTSMKQ